MHNDESFVTALLSCHQNDQKKLSECYSYLSRSNFLKSKFLKTIHFIHQRNWLILEKNVLEFPEDTPASFLVAFARRAVASLSLPGGQDRMISSIFPHFPVASLIFLQFFFIFFLILVFRVGGSPTREGPGYATVCT